MHRFKQMGKPQLVIPFYAAGKKPISVLIFFKMGVQGSEELEDLFAMDWRPHSGSVDFRHARQP
tara:strand:- start:288 stop:479 length:192 start_codon:yes stop_codon:yes gene_type:complete